MPALIAISPASTVEPRAIVELFTSQGCSSCPAADRLIGELTRDPSLVTLSLNVDYWDYIGWKDTLALHGHTVRQQAYSRARGDREIYTPQAVINGVAHALGSDKAAIERAIVKTQQGAKSLTVPVTLAIAGDAVTVKVLASTSGQTSGEIWLCPVISKISVAVGRGENNGRNLTYYNVVRGWTKVGDYTGKAETFHVPIASVTGQDIDSVAVVIQSGASANPGIILGAALSPLR